MSLCVLIYTKNSRHGEPPHLVACRLGNVVGVQHHLEPLDIRKEPARRFIRSENDVFPGAGPAFHGMGIRFRLVARPPQYLAQPVQFPQFDEFEKCRAGDVEIEGGIPAARLRRFLVPRISEVRPLNRGARKLAADRIEIHRSHTRRRAPLRLILHSMTRNACVEQHVQAIFLAETVDLEIGGIVVIVTGTVEFRPDESAFLEFLDLADRVGIVQIDVPVTEENIRVRGDGVSHELEILHPRQYTRHRVAGTVNLQHLLHPRLRAPAVNVGIDDEIRPLRARGRRFRRLGSAGHAERRHGGRDFRAVAEEFPFPHLFPQIVHGHITSFFLSPFPAFPTEDAAVTKEHDQRIIF